MPSRSIIFDAASSAVSTNPVGDNSLAWNHTIGIADTERALFVSFAMHTNTVSVTGVTFNGVAMSQIGAQNTGLAKVTVYVLANPDAGTHQISATFSAQTHAVGTAASYYGVDQSQQTSTGNATAGTSTTAAADVLSVGDDVVVGFFCKDATTEAATVGTGTERVKDLSSGGLATVNCYGMIADAAGTLGWMASALTYTWPTTSREWVCYSFAIKPASFVTAEGGITVDSTSSSNTGSAGATSLNWTHTLGSGTNRVGFLSIAEFTTGTVSATFPQYNDVTMTLVNSASITSNIGTKLYRVTVPDVDTSTKSIEITWTGSGRRAANFVVLSGCDQATPVGDDSTGSGTSTAATVSVTTIAGQLVLDSLAKRDSSENPNPGIGQALVEFDVTTNVTASNNVQTRTSSKSANVGTTNMNWSWATSRQWALIGVAVNPTAGFVSKITPEQLGFSPLSPLGEVH